MAARKTRKKRRRTSSSARSRRPAATTPAASADDRPLTDSPPAASDSVNTLGSGPLQFDVVDLAGEHPATDAAALLEAPPPPDAPGAPGAPGAGGVAPAPASGPSPNAATSPPAVAAAPRRPPPPGKRVTGRSYRTVRSKEELRAILKERDGELATIRAELEALKAGAPPMTDDELNATLGEAWGDGLEVLEELLVDTFGDHWRLPEYKRQKIARLAALAARGRVPTAVVQSAPLIALGLAVAAEAIPRIRTSARLMAERDKLARAEPQHAIVRDPRP